MRDKVKLLPVGSLHPLGASRTNRAYTGSDPPRILVLCGSLEIESSHTTAC